MAAGNSDQRSGGRFVSEQFASRSRELAEGRKHFSKGNGGGQEQARRLRARESKAAFEVARTGCAAGNLLRQGRGARRQDVCAVREFERNLSRESIGQDSDRQEAGRFSRSEID